MKRIAVFCGASSGKDPAFTEGARALGKLLAERRLELVYGGSSLGLMGAVSNAVIESGGSVIGVIPDFFIKREEAHTGLSDLRVVKTMHERKALMAELADGFIALPGGIGTLDELFEIATWAQLGLHRKPIGFLNVANYYDILLAYLDRCVEQGLLGQQYRELMLVDTTGEGLLRQFEDFYAALTLRS